MEVDDKRKMVPTTRSARSTQRAVWQEIAGSLDYVMLRQLMAGATGDEPHDLDKLVENIKCECQDIQGTGPF